MGYRTDVKKIIQAVSEELIQCRITQKPIWIGLKVKADDLNNSSISFASLGNNYLEQAMSDVYRQFVNYYPELQGFALYHYRGYRQLKE